jgi:hypothetical protein
MLALADILGCIILLRIIVLNLEVLAIFGLLNTEI